MAMKTEIAAKPAVPLDQVSLAFERTYLAHERTLMAWIRTAASLITFGFTLYKYFQYLHEQEPARQTHQLLGARTYGTIMIAIGVVTLALATWQHQWSIKRLRGQYPDTPFSLAFLLAFMISGLGILALVTALYPE
jgi:putative membrane protein